jgi:hypothetical protein
MLQHPYNLDLERRVGQRFDVVPLKPSSALQPDLAALFLLPHQEMPRREWRGACAVVWAVRAGDEGR